MTHFINWLTERRFNMIDLIFVAVAARFLAEHGTLLGLAEYLGILIIGAFVSVCVEQLGKKA
jgi:hypothetical protein